MLSAPVLFTPPRSKWRILEFCQVVRSRLLQPAEYSSQTYAIFHAGTTAVLFPFGKRLPFPPNRAIFTRSPSLWAQAIQSLPSAATAEERKFDKNGGMPHDRVNPSAGQTQQLTIARAMLQDAPIQNRTTFVIAKRLSAIKKTDRILMFNSGSVIEGGTHEEFRITPFLIPAPSRKTDSD